MSDTYIINALKELPVLKKRLEKTRSKLTEYSSGTTNMVPYFKDKAEQTKQVQALMDSAADITKRYLNLKRCIAYTNAVSTLEIEGRTFSITELIAIHKEMGYEMEMVYASVNDRNAKKTMSGLNTSSNDITTVLYYDQKELDKKAESWFTFYKKITAELEIFNARTLLLDVKTGLPLAE